MSENLRMREIRIMHQDFKSQVTRYVKYLIINLICIQYSSNTWNN